MPVSQDFEFAGIWQSSAVSVLILVSIILGILLYLSGNLKNFRTADSFIGGEKFQDKVDFSTMEYYKSISEFRVMNTIYRKAEDKWFDIYDLSKNFILWLSALFSNGHTGLLQDYAYWIFAGLIMMLLILL